MIDLDLFPETVPPPGLVAGVEETSIETARSIRKSKVEEDRRRILMALYTQAESRTDEELELLTGLNGNTLRPRRLSLVTEGLIERAGKSLTNSGHRAWNWRITRKGIEYIK